MSYAEKMAKGSAVVFTLGIVGAVLSYLFRLFLAQSLDVVSFGLFYSIIAFVGIFSPLQDLGLTIAMPKFVAEFKAKRRMKSAAEAIFTSMTIQTTIMIIMAVVIALLSGWLAENYFGMQDAVLPLMLILVSSVFGVVITSLQTAHQGLSRFAAFSVVEPLRMTIVFAIAVPLIWLGTTGAAVAYAGAAAIVSAYMIISIKKHVKKKLSFSSKMGKKLILFGLPVFLGGMSTVILTYTDTIMLTVFRSLEEVGFYHVALPTSRLLWFFAIAISVILLPMVSEMWARKDKKNVTHLTSLLIKISFIVIIPLAILLIAFPDIIIRLLFGEAYLAASGALQILAVTAIFYTIFAIANTTIIAINKPIITTKVTAIIAGINVLLNFIFIPQFGIVAAAAATAISYFIGAMIFVYVLRKNLKITLKMRTMGTILFGGVITLTIIYLLKEVLVLNVWLEAVVSLALGFVFYSVFILSTKSIKKSDLIMLKNSRIPVPRVLVIVADRLTS